jgi:hypothetical protein
MNTGIIKNQNLHILLDKPGKTLYNSYYDHCDFCCVPEFEPKPCCPYDSDMSVFDIDLFKSWENKWLYGDC